MKSALSDALSHFSRDENDEEETDEDFDPVADFVSLLKDPKAKEDELIDAFKAAVNHAVEEGQEDEDEEEKPALKIKIGSR